MFGNPNIERMAEERDFVALYQCLEHRDPVVRLEAAQALADLNDGAGWRYLMDNVRQGGEIEERAMAASMLGELGHPRAVPVLAEAIAKVRLNPRAAPLMTALRNALEAIGTPEAEDALREAGFEPVLPVQHHTLIEYADHYTPPVLRSSGEINFRTAEQHLDSAVELREGEMAERGLVEATIALSLRPDWAYAWYLRGVLFEDLDRYYEAGLAYRRAVELDPHLVEAVDALKDLNAEYSDQLQIDDDPLLVREMLSIRDWSKRRDAAAAVPVLAERGGIAPDDVDALVALLGDEEREVRHAAIEALGAMRGWINEETRRKVVDRLLEMQDSSWLARFSIINTLAELGSCGGVLTALYREMARVQERNPVFSSQKDPLLEVEYDALMEIGVRALERTGDINTLLDVAEGHEWEEARAAAEQHSRGPWQGGESYVELSHGVAEEAEGDDEEAEDEAEAEAEEAEDDLTPYVDEVAEMAAVALERLALPRMDDLSKETLARIAAVPDLTLLDLSQDEPEPQVVYSLNGLRERARQALAVRK